MTAFNRQNAFLDDYLDSNIYPPRYEVTALQSLKKVIEVGLLPPTTEVLSFEHEDQLLLIPLATAIRYNVIQGQLNEQSWVMTFCNACNTGMVFDPVLDDELLRFQRRGSYNGLLLIWDDTTDTYWNHITGEALHGTKTGNRLDILTLMRRMTAQEALTKNANALVLIVPITNETEANHEKLMEKMLNRPDKFVAPVIDMLSYEDTRLPRFDLGLGLWEGQDGEHSTFYPISLLFACDNVLFTTFQSRSVVIYQSPDAASPVAVYLEGVHQAYWRGDALVFDNGGVIENDQYTNPAGEIEELDQPMQLLMRWYGFALTFPDCEIGQL